MTSKPETNGDESFIILGSSPGTSLDLKCNGIEGPSLDRVALDDAMKDLSPEASTAFKAHFKLEDGPSPASLMAASSIITDDTSTEQLQKHFGELLDENVILKETLKKNNDSMKEQFLLIASCQEDMMKTHMLHKEKFDETRMLVEKLRQENKRLKLDIVRLAESEQSASGPTSAKSSGPPSALEFVTSPDDDTINKLTAQLELVEKQRRQVIVENEKLTWQKESLEHIIDATSKERDDLKEKLKNSELKLLSIESEHDFKVTALNNSIQDLESKLEAANRTIMEKRPDLEIKQRNEMIMQLEQKVSALQNDLKMAQLKILELEDVKLKFVAYKSNTSSSRKSDEETILMLVKKLKEASDTVFTPARCTVSAKDEASTLEGLTEYEKFKASVKLYDKTLKHLATYINSISSGSVDMLVEGIGVVASIQEMPMDGPHAEQFKSSLGHLKERIEKMYDVALKNINQVKSSLSIFEGMFLDHVDILKKLENSPETRKRSPPPQTTDQLTNALLARGQEIQLLKSELVALRDVGDDRHVLQAQIDLYKSDFEAERQAREKMASEKENILTDLRSAQRLNQEYKIQLEEVRKLNPNIYRSATTKKMPPSLYPGTGTSNTRPTTGTGSAWTRPSGTQGARRQSAPGTATGNMVRKKQKVSEGEEKETTPPPLRFDCPVCDQPFKSLILLQQHVETCLL